MKKFAFPFVILLIFSGKIAAQNVGIGTTTPKARLHVADSSVVFTAGDPYAAIPGPLPISGAGARMLWYPGKAAFRAGFANALQWDKDSIGFFSLAAGYGTRATNIQTTALGLWTLASGEHATATGYITTASGNNSTAMGSYSVATGDVATALGSGNFANGFASTAIGFSTIANGSSSMATGSGSVANADYSAAMGYYTKSKSPKSMVIGSFNDTSNTNRLFEIGNGTANNVRSNAMTVLMNGNIGIGISNPVARLQVEKKSVLFKAPYPNFTTYDDIPYAGSTESAMIWYADKAAFLTGAAWDNERAKDSVGFFSVSGGLNCVAPEFCSIALGQRARAYGFNSVALGLSPKAFGSNSVAIGWDVSATGAVSIAIGYKSLATKDYAIAMGYNSLATQDHAIAMGRFSTASNYSAVALGEKNTASGGFSVATGVLSVASGESSFATGNTSFARANGGFTSGIFNDSTDAPNPSVTAATDRLFQIGNGTSNAARSNALTILRSGNMGIGTTNPAKRLEVIGPGDGTPVTLRIGNRSGFGPTALEFISDYGASNQWRPGFIKTNDLGVYTGALEFYTNGTGIASLNGSVKGFEIRNGAALTATGAVGSYSDARLKNNITSFTDGLNVITKINPVQFYYNADAPFKTDQQQIGIIAQELETVAPYMVEKNADASIADLRSVNNQAYIFLLINAIKEQQQQIEALTKTVSELKSKL